MVQENRYTKKQPYIKYYKNINILNILHMYIVIIAQQSPVQWSSPV